MILDVQDLSFRYSKNAKPIFHNVNFQMEKGEILTILGANGAGKSTLLKLSGKYFGALFRKDSGKWSLYS